VYTAFTIDVFSRKIVGWKTSMSKETGLVLDTIEMGLDARGYRDKTGEGKLVHHSDAGSQYASFRFTQHLIDCGVDASIGTVGDALHNAHAESLIGLHKTELIKTARAMAYYPRSRRCHGGMGGLVQQPSIAQSLPRQTTGGVRDPVRAGPPDQLSRLTPTIESLPNPGWFTHQPPRSP
jgi:transposase InsO family protein